MPTSTTHNITSNSILPAPTESSPLLRARYSTGYNEPIPGLSPASPGSTSWTRYITTQPASAPESHEFTEMPTLMSFISLLPPPREISYDRMERVLPTGLSPVASAHSSSYGENSARKTSFLLAALLWLYIHPTSSFRELLGDQNITGTWDFWKKREDELKGRRVLLNLIKRVWGSFVEGESGRQGGSVEEVLWTEIPMEENSRQTIRVIDLAVAQDAPIWFLSHPLVTISLRLTWSHGIPGPATAQSTWVAYDRFSTPRITHAIFLMHHFIYLFTLAHLVLAAPSSPFYSLPQRKPSYREYYLLLYSISGIPFNITPTLSVLPYLFVASGILLAYPSIPTPNTNTHALLLLSLSLFLLQSHLPDPVYIPSPLYLFEPKRVLPLATLVKGLLKRAVRPGIFFFGPVVVLTGMLLAGALGDHFPLVGLQVGDFIERLYTAPGNQDSNHVEGASGHIEVLLGPSHPQTRITLLLLFLSSLAAMFTLINCLVTLFPGSVSSKGVLENIDEHEDYHLDSRHDVQPAHVASSSAAGGRNGGEGWKLQSGITSTILEERYRLFGPSPSGLVGGGPWERYGPATAMSAKRSFANMIRRYQHLRLITVTHEALVDSTSSRRGNASIRKPCGRVVLPPVFNVVAWILGVIPATVLRLFTEPSAVNAAAGMEAGRSHGVDSTLADEDDGAVAGIQGSSGSGQRWRGNYLNKTAERWEGLVTRAVWRVVVGLPGLIVAGVWFWK
ncbi:hypothetical protein CPB86DRAFT_784732 [Serendipita vermifera]|nr:hypothetical protein CPB86DRAFT_784732 [Serendipita vermifera]